MSSIAAWWIYGGVVAGLLGLAAWVLEAGAREVGRPSRWIWLGAMGLSVVLPLVAVLTPPSVAGQGAAVPGIPVLVLPAVAVAAEGGGNGWGMDRVLVVGWAMASLALGAWVVLSALRLAGERRRWSRASFYGERVWVTADVGPAVLGWIRPEIVIPRWALALESAAQRLLLVHEREHVRAGDPRALLAGMAAVILVPWNPVVWWMLARLRLAVEVDCDARVLHSEPDPRAYGRVLLEVGRHRSAAALAVAFAEPRRFLERRIRRISAKRSAHAVGRGLVLGSIGLIPLVVAVCARDPMAVANPMENAALEPEDLTVQLANGPTFTPFTVRPELENAVEVQAALRASYPPLLRDAGISGRSTVWFYIDATGRVVRTQLNQSSGYDALDQAALRVATMMRFTPALNRDTPVPVWVSIPIAFSSAGARARREAAEPEDVALGPGSAPTFTQYTQKPALQNVADVQRALQRNYPPLLRDAGIAGKAVVWVFVESDGRVSRTQLSASSGYEALDRAALEVVSVMRFAPAENRGRPVAAWIQLPVSFSSK